MDIGLLIRSSPDPSRCAVSLERGLSLSYKEFALKVNRYANALLRLKIQKGDRVGILMYNSLEYLALYFAIVRIAAIAVRINFRLAPSELDFIIKDAGLKLLCFHAPLEEGLAEAFKGQKGMQGLSFPYRGKTGSLKTIPSDSLEMGDEKEPGASFPSLDDPAMLMYTSGTTGLPKGALWSHGNTLWFASMQAMRWRLGPEAVSLVTGPLYHVGAFEDLSSAVLLLKGHAVFMESGGFEIERVLRTIQEHRVTHALLFPFMLYRLLRIPNLSSYDLSSLKAIISGGDPVLPWAVEGLKKALPWVGLVQIYGLTEGTPIAAASSPEESLDHPDLVGRPMPLTDLKVVREDGGEATPWEVGEIWVKSPAVVQGYWKRPLETKETFIEGWCKTGDLGYRTHEGLFGIAGRKKDMIRSGGENIYPAEIEDVLLRHPYIQDAAVIGIPDPEFLEAVCAVIVSRTKENLSLEEVQAWCRKRLAGYKIPKRIEFTSEIPRTNSGKILKHEIRERYTEGREPRQFWDHRKGPNGALSWVFVPGILGFWKSWSCLRHLERTRRHRLVS